jgi:hypothetical protein
VGTNHNVLGAVNNDSVGGKSLWWIK